mgnify:CR=1 FL=1
MIKPKPPVDSFETPITNSWPWIGLAALAVTAVVYEVNKAYVKSQEDERQVAREQDLEGSSRERYLPLPETERPYKK